MAQSQAEINLKNSIAHAADSGKLNRPPTSRSDQAWADACKAPLSSEERKARDAQYAQDEEWYERGRRNGLNRRGNPNKVRPKPKFKVGSVLSWDDDCGGRDYGRVIKISWQRGGYESGESYDPGWLYHFNCGEIGEYFLRPLTKREKG